MPCSLGCCWYTRLRSPPGVTAIRRRSHHRPRRSRYHRPRRPSPWVSPGASRAADPSALVLLPACWKRGDDRTCDPILLAVVAAALLAACGRGGASPLPADQPPAFNDADVGFLQSMIPHHQQAISMAKLATGRTRRPELGKLAATITTRHATEIGSWHGCRRLPASSSTLDS